MNKQLPHIQLPQKTMVLKIEQDRPVRPPTGHDSCSIWSFKPESVQTGIRPVKPVVRPVNQINQTVSLEPSSSTFLFFHCRRPPSAGPPPRARKAPSCCPPLLEKPPSSPSPASRNPPFFLRSHPPTPCTGRRNENPK